MEGQIKIKVLICDDFPPILDVIHQMLKRTPSIEVVGTAEDGIQAVKKTMDLNPDVVLMDFQMPGLNGVDATRLIKMARKDTKVLLLTAESREEVLIPCLQAGASDCLSKPFSPHDLIRTIVSMQRGKRLAKPEGPASMAATA